LGNLFLRITTELVDGVSGMDFREDELGSVIRQQPEPPIYPNRFSRDRCNLLIRFLVLLASGATVFQMGMFVLYYRPSYLLILVVLLTISAIILFVAYRDLRKILKLRSEAKELEKRLNMRKRLHDMA
jgi:hypothetical protein